MTLSLRERLELMRQGVVRGYIIPSLEERGYIVSGWKRPISLEDKILRDGGWEPIYTRFTSWETYRKDQPLYIFFNTFYGDVYERAYRNCFVEFLLNAPNLRLKPSLIGIFTRLNTGNGYYWKHRIPIDLNYPEACVRDIDATYDELTLTLSKEGVLKQLEEQDDEK